MAQRKARAGRPAVITDGHFDDKAGSTSPCPPGSRQFREVVTRGSSTTHRKVAEKPSNTYQMRQMSAFAWGECLLATTWPA